MKEKKNTVSSQYRHSQELLVEQICEYARENVGKKITLKDVAQYCGVSVSTVTQLFRKAMDGTFHSYLTRLRMEKAGELIREGVALEEVGRQVGYTDHSSFYRAFCQTFSQSPRAYKQGIPKK